MQAAAETASPERNSDHKLRTGKALPGSRGRLTQASGQAGEGKKLRNSRRREHDGRGSEGRSPNVAGTGAESRTKPREGGVTGGVRRGGASGWLAAPAPPLSLGPAGCRQAPPPRPAPRPLPGSRDGSIPASLSPLCGCCGRFRWTMAEVSLCSSVLLHPGCLSARWALFPQPPLGSGLGVGW